MKINIYTFKRSKPDTYEVFEYIKSNLCDSGRSGDSIKELSRLLENQSHALALILTNMAKEGKISPKEITGLSNDYCEDAEFIKGE